MWGKPGIAHTPAYLAGEVRFGRHGDRLWVEHATPVMWFPQHILEQSQTNPEVGLSFDGMNVTLRASNGLWVWRLTGRRWRRPRVPGAMPFIMVEGMWPD